MNLSHTPIVVESLSSYDTSDLAAIGQILLSLSPNFSSETALEDLLRQLIDSPSHEQLVARDTSGRIVGIATLSVTIGIGAGRKAYLEDFVVDSQSQSQGVGGCLWGAMLDWCRTHQAVSLNFTSRTSRSAAHAFYLKHGAEIRETTCFSKSI